MPCARGSRARRRRAGSAPAAAQERLHERLDDAPLLVLQCIVEGGAVVGIEERQCVHGQPADARLVKLGDERPDPRLLWRPRGRNERPSESVRATVASVGPRDVQSKGRRAHTMMSGARPREPVGAISCLAAVARPRRLAAGRHVRITALSHEACARALLHVPNDQLVVVIARHAALPSADTQAVWRRRTACACACPIHVPHDQLLAPCPCPRPTRQLVAAIARPRCLPSADTCRQLALSYQSVRACPSHVPNDQLVAVIARHAVLPSADTCRQLT